LLETSSKLTLLQKTNVPYSMMVYTDAHKPTCQLNVADCQVFPQLIGGSTTNINISIQGM